MTRIVFASFCLLSLFTLSCSRVPKRVVIGIALTRSNHPAAQLALDEINARGGVNGIPMAAMGLDWKVARDFGSEEILKWAEDFARNEDLVAVVGHSDSTATLSAAAFYNQHQIPQLVTIATNPAITNIGDWTYRLCISDLTQGKALARYAVKDWGKKSICIFYVNDAYGKGLAEILQREVRDLGAKVVANRMHRNELQDQDKETITATLAELKRTGAPDLFVLIQRIVAANWTIAAIRKAGFNSSILGADNLAQPEFLRRNAELCEGIRVSQFYLPSPDDSAAMKFLNSFRQANGSEPDYGQAFAYDAVYLVRDAVARFGFSRSAVKKYLDYLITEQVAVHGVGGDYLLGPDHDARRGMYIAEARNGRYERVMQINPGE